MEGLFVLRRNGPEEGKDGGRSCALPPVPGRAAEAPAALLSGASKLQTGIDRRPGAATGNSPAAHRCLSIVFFSLLTLPVAVSSRVTVTAATEVNKGKT
jgi:hypothetical protein